MTSLLRELPGSDHPPSASVNAEALGRVPDGETITVSIYLKPRPEDAARFHSRATLGAHRAETHGPDLAAIRGFAAAHGLDVVAEEPARRLVQIRGGVRDVEAAFGTELHVVKRGGDTFRARTGALHLPAELIDRVDAVLGLSTTPVATPKIVPHRGPTPPKGYLPTEVASLYGFADANADASGQCIAIVELGGGYTAADNQAAFKAMGLVVPKIVAVDVDGAKNNPADTSGANGEVALDIQVAGGFAHGAWLAVYFAPNTSQGFVDAITQAIHDQTNTPAAVSISWGSAESVWTPQDITAMSAAFADAAKLGVTVTAASGDALATDGVADGKAHVDYPASDPSVLGCGGTFLATSAGKITAETVWRSNGGGTGGGVSVLFAPPAYQHSLKLSVKGHKGGGRGVPDVAGDADPDSGFRIVTNGQSGVIGGTSAVAPLWAAVAVVLGKALGKPIGAPHAMLYGTPSALNDVTSGDNKSGAIGFTAKPGWDACTGLGTPNGDRLRKLFGIG